MDLFEIFIKYYLLGVFLNSFFTTLIVIMLYDKEEVSYYGIKDSFMLLFTVLSSFLTPIAAIFTTVEIIREIKAEMGIDYES